MSRPSLPNETLTSFSSPSSMSGSKHFYERWDDHVETRVRVITPELVNVLATRRHMLISSVLLRGCRAIALYCSVLSSCTLGLAGAPTTCVPRTCRYNTTPLSFSFHSISILQRNTNCSFPVFLDIRKTATFPEFFVGT